MFRRNVCLLSIFLFAFCVLLTGCTGKQGISYEYCDVMIESGANYSVYGAIQTVRRGADVSFLVQLQDGYHISGIDYEHAQVQKAEVSQLDGKTYETVVLKNIRYPLVVKLETEAVSLICYHGNGGTAITDGADSITVVKGNSHSRTNTLLAKQSFTRKGHTLTGWNTRMDGKGKRIGLGSRADADTKDLYACWEKWTNAAVFRYRIEDGEAKIFGINKSEETDEKLSIPSELEGCPVTEIEKYAFQGCEYRTIILAPGMKRVEEKAFADCKVQELFLYDDIREISDGSFSGCQDLETIYINAVLPPVYSGSYFDVFTDKMDWLIEQRMQKKIVLFAGSTTRFGYDSKKIEENISGYTVANMGVYAYCNAMPQIEMIQKFLNKGDIFLNSPEFDAIDTQFCVSNELDTEIFYMTESNYDLLSLLDCRGYVKIFDNFNQFLKEKKDMTPKGYQIASKNYDEDGNRLTNSESYNCYGDYIVPRPNQDKDEAIGIKLADYSIDSFGPAVLENLKNRYQKMLSEGIKVYFTYSPRSLCAITEESTPAMRARLQQYLKKNLNVPVISEIEESLYPGYYFYGTDNHLSDEGVQMHTDTIISDLKRQMRADHIS